jgi:hypothetical protein
VLVLLLVGIYTEGPKIYYKAVGKIWERVDLCNKYS